MGWTYKELQRIEALERQCAELAERCQRLEQKLVNRRRPRRVHTADCDTYAGGPCDCGAEKD